MKLLILILTAIMLTGCATSEQLAKNLNSKNISGTGFLSKSKIGIDTDTMTPTIDTLFVSGNFKTIKANTNFIDIVEEESSSIFNAEAKTSKKQITITLNNNVDVKTILEIFAK